MSSIPVAFLPAANDACALYREFIPHLSTPNSRYLYRTTALDIRELDGCKVAVVQRQLSDFNYNAMIKIKERGIKIIYDLDDNIWSLPAYNPGKNIFEACQDGFYKCAKEADALTVSTLGLASATRTGFKLNKEMQIIPNAIDFNMFRPKTLQKDDQVIVGWGGSNTHWLDVKDAFEAVLEVIEEHETVCMELVGAPAIHAVYDEIIGGFEQRHQRMKRKRFVMSGITNHPKTRFRNWVPVGEYPNRLASWGWDIATAPLEDNRFNRSKSNIKMLEAAAIQIPCLASDVQPYVEFCSLDKELNWLLCRGPKDWKEKLTTLIHEPEQRTYLAKRMYDVAFKFYNIDTIKENWNYVFNKVLS